MFYLFLSCHNGALPFPDSLILQSSSGKKKGKKSTSSASLDEVKKHGRVLRSTRKDVEICSLLEGLVSHLTINFLL